MRTSAARFLPVFFISTALFAQAGPQAAGHWQGKIQTPSQELPVSVDLDRNAKGAWIGSMSVTGSPLVDVPLGSVAVDGASVKFTANLGTPASFSGKISEDGKTLSGTASSAAGETPFQLTRAGEATVKVPPPSSALTKEFEGAWEGSLAAMGTVLRLGLKLAPAPDGSATATLISYDQGNASIPVDTVTIDGKQLQLDVRAIAGSYKGTLGAGGEIAGEWKQGPNTLPLTLKRPAAPAKPQ